MPSRNPQTGRRISGGAQRKRAELRKLPAKQPEPTAEPTAELVDDPFVGLAKPPVADGVDAVCSWASSILGVAVAALSVSISPKAVLLSRAIKALGRLTGRALRSEKALRLRQLRLGTPYDLSLPECPADELARHAWAFCRLSLAIHEVAAAATMDEEAVHRFLMLVDALATFEKVSADASFTALLRQLDGGD